MSHRMAAQRVPSQHNDIHREHKRADSHAERDRAGRGIREPERFPNIGCQYEKKNYGKIKKVTMDILNDQGEGILTTIMLPRLCNRASRRIQPERLVICSAVVIARQPKTTRTPKYQECRRERQPQRKPARLRPEPGVRRIAEDFRRVKRRKIWPPIIVVSLKCRPCRIDNECR